MSSFLQYLESRKMPTVTVSLDYYKETVEREIYDHLLNQNRDFAFSHIEEITNLRNNLLLYPKKNEVLLAVATRDSLKIKQAHEQFAQWAKKSFFDGSLVEAALFEIRSYLYGRNISFSKEAADRIVNYVFEESQRNIKHIVDLLEQGIQRGRWNESTVIVKAIPNELELITNEAMIIVGQPPALTFMCKNNNPLEVFDVQDVATHPVSLQEDYLTLVNWLQNPIYARFNEKYAVVPSTKRYLLEQIKRDISLGMERELPAGIILYDEMPKSVEDIWQIKFKNKVYTEEVPIRWLQLIKKAEE